MDAHSRDSARWAALVLVAASAAGGVFACAIGALKWGFLGLSLGLAGAWAFFLLGLFGLYHREQRKPAREPSRAFAASPPPVELTPAIRS